MSKLTDKPLTTIDPKDIDKIWETIVEAAPPGRDGQPHITAALVEDQVKRWLTGDLGPDFVTRLLKDAKPTTQDGAEHDAQRDGGARQPD